MTNRTYPHGIAATRADVREGMRVRATHRAGAGDCEGVAQMEERSFTVDGVCFNTGYNGKLPVTILIAPDADGSEWELGVPGDQLQVGDVVKVRESSLVTPRNQNRWGPFTVTSVHSSTDRGCAVARGNDDDAEDNDWTFYEYETFDRQVTPPTEQHKPNPLNIVCHPDGSEWETNIRGEDLGDGDVVLYRDFPEWNKRGPFIVGSGHLPASCQHRQPGSGYIFDRRITPPAPSAGEVVDAEYCDACNDSGVTGPEQGTCPKCNGGTDLPPPAPKPAPAPPRCLGCNEPFHESRIEIRDQRCGDCVQPKDNPELTRKPLRLTPPMRRLHRGYHATYDGPSEGPNGDE